jgi:hypothetical protein
MRDREALLTGCKRAAAGTSAASGTVLAPLLELLP